jgi:ceramide glucosyltransferase
MLAFYFFAAIAVWLGVVSLRGGVRFSAYVRRETARPHTDYTPFASVIAPFRGLDQGLRENLSALFLQDYPAYEIIFVTDSSDDSAIEVVTELRKSLNAVRGITSRLLIAGDAIDSGQKVHNLRAAVAEPDPRSEVLVFVDTDARPHDRWLRSLVAPLIDERIGAATGYRWFIPVNGGFASHLRSVWNASIASALGERDDKNFCWGGSTAIRRAVFERLKVVERWRGTVSDDFTLTRGLQEAKLPIHFVPQCLVASFDDCGFRELLEFATRQLKITRVYATHLWKAVLLGGFLFVPVFFCGIALVIVRAALGLTIIAPLLLLIIIFALGAAKSWIRFRAANIALANYSRPGNSLLAHLFLWPLASALFLFNAIAAACSRRIRWRGITYELKSPTEAVIIARES